MFEIITMLTALPAAVLAICQLVDWWHARRARGQGRKRLGVEEGGVKC